MKLATIMQNRRGILALTGALLAGSGVPAASAANITWDITPGTVGTGDGTLTDGAGTWDNATGNFTTDGGLTNVAWNNTANAADTAVFGASYNATSGTAVTGGTVTVGAGGITLGGISLVGKTSPNYTIAGGTLTFGQATSTISLTSSAYNPNLTISSVIAGNALVLAPTSAANYGYLTLSGSNTYSGGTTVGNALQLTVGSSSALGTGAVTVNGSYFNLNTSAAVTLANSFTLTNAMTVNASNAITLSGALTGSGAITKTGSSDLTISGANTAYTGTVNLRGGTVRVSNTSSGSTTALLGSGAISAGTSTTNGSIGVTLATQYGSLATTLANNIAITNNGTGTTTLSVDGGYANLTLSGVITGNGILAKVSTGTVALNGVNTYTGGTQLASGTTSFSNANAFGTGAVTVLGTYPGNTGVSSSNTPFIQYNGSAASVAVANSLALPAPTTATVYTISQNGGSSQTLALNGVVSGGNAFTTLELNSQASGDATSVFALNGANTLAGLVYLNRGSLSIGNAAALGTASLTMDSYTSTVLSFSVPLTLPNGITNTTAYSINTNANAVTLSGVMGGTKGITLVGTGSVLTLSGTNTYAGGTTISAGQLLANNATSSLGTGTTTVTAGLLAGTGATGGAVNLSGGSISAGTGSSATSAIGKLTVGVPGTPAPLTQTAASIYYAKIDGTQTLTATGQTPHSGTGTVYTGGSDEMVLSVLTINAGNLTVSPVMVSTGSLTNTATSNTTYDLVIADSTAMAPSAFAALFGSIKLPSTTPSGGSYALDYASDGNGGTDLLLDFTPSATPEPTSLLLAGLAAAPLALGRRRRTA